MSEILLAPPATATAKSTSARPGSCRPRGFRSPASTSECSPAKVIRSAHQPAAATRSDTTLTPSAVAMTFGRVVVACTSNVLLYLEDLGPQQAQFPLVAGHFGLSKTEHADQLMKSRG
jgi:hypothetical protein